MAIDKKIILYQAERLDLPDFNSIQTFLEEDFQNLNKRFFAGTTTNWIVKGFEPSVVVNLDISISTLDSAIFNVKPTDTYSGTLFTTDSTSVALTSTLTDNVTNYVHIKLNSGLAEPDTRVFWDPTVNNGAGGEWQQTVNTQEIIEAELYVSSTSFSADPHYTPVAMITTSSGQITKILDRRNLFFRLEGGYPYAPGSSYWTGKDRTDNVHEFTLSAPSGTFLLGDVVTAPSGGTGIVTTAGTTQVYISTTNAITFAIGEVISGATLPAAPHVTGTLVSITDTFNTGDKQISSLKDWLNAMCSCFQDLSGGTSWYEAPTSSWIGHIAATTNVHGTGMGNAVVGTGTAQILTNKTINDPISGDILKYFVPIGSIIPFYDFNGTLLFDAAHWALCDGTIKTVAGIGAQTLPDLSGRYLVGFGTDGGGDIGSAIWSAAPVGNVNHQINLQHLHSINHGHADTLAFTGPSHDHSIGAHYHGKGTLSISGGSHVHGTYYYIQSGGGGGPERPASTTYTAGPTLENDVAASHAHPSGEFSGSVGNTGGSNGDAAFTSGAGGTGACGKSGSVTAFAGNSGNTLSTTQSIQPRSVCVRYIMRII